jgi:hypothetical protein
MHSKTAQLLRGVERLVSKYGLVGAVGILNSLSDNHARNTNVLKDLVLALTCAEFQIEKSDLTSNRTLGGKRTDALKVAAFVLVKHASMSQKEVSQLLGKDKSAISKYLQEIAHLNERITPDALLIEKLHSVEERFKSTIKLDNDGRDTETAARQTAQEPTSTSGSEE